MEIQELSQKEALDYTPSQMAQKMRTITGKMPRAVQVNPIMVPRRSLVIGRPGEVLFPKVRRLSVRLFKHTIDSRSGNQGEKEFNYSIDMGTKGFRTDDKSRCEWLLDGFSMEEGTKFFLESRSNGIAYKCLAIPEEAILEDDGHTTYALPNTAPMAPVVGDVAVQQQPKRGRGRPSREEENDGVPNAPSESRNGPSVAMPIDVGRSAP